MLFIASHFVGLSISNKQWLFSILLFAQELIHENRVWEGVGNVALAFCSSRVTHLNWPPCTLQHHHSAPFVSETTKEAHQIRAQILSLAQSLSNLHIQNA